MTVPSVDDAVEIGQLLAKYALHMTRDDIDAVINEVFAPGGTYSAFGSTYQLKDFPELVAAAPKGLFLVGPPVLDIAGDAGSGQQRCVLSTKQTTTCGSAGTPIRTPVPSKAGACGLGR